jgi:hypothetical protein
MNQMTSETPASSKSVVSSKEFDRMKKKIDLHLKKKA